jgi:hypothetical protein
MTVIEGWLFYLFFLFFAVMAAKNKKKDRMCVNEKCCWNFVMSLSPNLELVFQLEVQHHRKRFIKELGQLPEISRQWE